MKNMPSVIDYSDCYSRKIHKLGGLKSKHLFLIVLEGGKSKIKVLADLGSSEGLLPVAISSCPHITDGETDLSLL